MQLVEQITRNPSKGAIIQYCNFPTDEDSIFNARQRIMHCLVTGSLPFLYDVWLDLSQDKEFLLSNPGKKPDVEFWCAALPSGEVLRKYYRDGAFNLAWVSMNLPYNQTLTWRTDIKHIWLESRYHSQEYHQRNVLLMRDC